MGPLNGYTIIELAGIGPAPMGGMMLADMGAELIRIDRAGGADPRLTEKVSGRRSVGRPTWRLASSLSGHAAGSWPRSEMIARARLSGIF